MSLEDRIKAKQQPRVVSVDAKSYTVDCGLCGTQHKDGEPCPKYEEWKNAQGD